MRSVAIGFVDNRQRLPEQQRTIIGGGVFSGPATACHSFDTASTLDGTIWGRFMAIGPYSVSPFLMRSLHTVYPAVDLAEKPRIGV